MKFLYSIYLKVKNLSLTARLLLFLAIISLCAWSAATIISVNTSSKYIKTYFDTQLILVAKTLVNMHMSPIQQNLPETKKLMGIDDDGKYKREDDDAMGFALFSANGAILLTDGENGKDFPFLKHEQGFAKHEVDGEAWRIFWIHSANKEHIAAVGQEIGYRQSMIWQMLLGQLVPWLIVLPLIVGGFAGALYLELRPLRRIASHLSLREAQDTNPISYHNAPSEILPLIHALNTLFERVGLLLEHERAFVANAAHELRTPLAGLRIQAEVLAMSEPEEQRQYIEKILQATLKCSKLVDQLLLLSQLDAKFSISLKDNQDIKDFEIVNFEKILDEAYTEAKEQASYKNIQLSYIVHALPTNMTGINDLWSIAIRNVLHNAINYTQDGGKVHISIYSHALCVENSGNNIDENILVNLGKRFYRPACINNSPLQSTGSGLGLAIVKHIAKLHKVDFTLSNRVKGQASSHTPINYTPYIAQENGVLACFLFYK